MSIKTTFLVGFSFLFFSLYAGVAVDTSFKSYSNAIRIDSIRNQMQKLQNFGTRYATKSNRRTIAESIRTYFSKLRMQKIAIDSFIPQDAQNLPRQYNVIASIPGTVNPQKVVIIGAHYDATSNDASLDNTPGADDNCSGVAAMLEIARVLTHLKYKPHSTLTFIAFAAEEPSPYLLGAADYAKKASNQGIDITLALCLDMLAWTSDNSHWQLNVEQYPGQEYLMPLIEKAVARVSTIQVAYHGQSPYSDSYPFFLEGFPAVWIVENYGTASHPLGVHPYYHTTNDRLDKYDLRYCTEMTKAICGIVLYADQNIQEQTEQQITFEPIPEKQFTDSAFVLDANASSGLPVLYTSSNLSVVQIIKDSLAKIVGAGTSIITASQPGNTQFAAATPVSQTLTVHKSPAKIIISNVKQIYDGKTKAPTITTSPPGLLYDVIFGKDSLSINPIDVGTYYFRVVITDKNYSATRSDSLFIQKAKASLTLSNLSFLYDGTPKHATISTTPQNLSVKIVYTGKDGNDTCGKNAGTYSVNATITEKNYEGSKTAPLVISPASLTIAADNKTRIYKQQNPILTATYTGFVLNENEQNLTAKPIITTAAHQFSPCSTYAITASNAWASNYQLHYIDGILTITKATQEILFPPLKIMTTKSLDFNPLASVTSGLRLTYTSSNVNVALILDSLIHIVGPGTSIISALQSGNENYFPALSVSQVLTVEVATNTILPEQTDSLQDKFTAFPRIVSSKHDTWISFYLHTINPVRNIHLIIYDPLGTTLYSEYTPFHKGGEKHAIFRCKADIFHTYGAHKANLFYIQSNGQNTMATITFGVKKE